MAEKGQFKDRELSSSHVFILVFCLSITINLSFLYFSGILGTTAKNLDEMSKLTNAAARVAGGIADYLDVFHRLERLERFENYVSVSNNNKEVFVLQLPQTQEISFFEKLCPDFICGRENLKA